MYAFLSFLDLGKTRLCKRDTDIVDDMLDHIATSDVLGLDAIQVEVLADDKTPDRVTGCLLIVELWTFWTAEDRLGGADSEELRCLGADKLGVLERLGKLAAA